MPALKMILNGDGAWPDLKDKMVHHTTDTIQVAMLRGGMTSGKNSVAFRIDLPNGDVVIAETSLALFVSAARGFEARAAVEEGGDG